jgi:hypothetical protein
VFEITIRCPNCGGYVEDGFMGITGHGALGAISEAKWIMEKSTFVTGGESLNLGGSLRGMI